MYVQRKCTNNKAKHMVIKAKKENKSMGGQDRGRKEMLEDSVGEQLLF